MATATTLTLPEVDLVDLGLASENKDSYTRRGRVVEPDELSGSVAELDRLVGGLRRSGRWLKGRCPFHRCSRDGYDLKVAPTGWCLCVSPRCGESGWADTIVKRLTGVCNGNFVSERFREDKARVVSALRATGREKLAHEMEMCGRYFKVYKCENDCRPGYPVSCKSPYCVRCRGRRLYAHLSGKGPLFESLSRPVGVLVSPPSIEVSDATDARAKVRDQTDRLKKTLRSLSALIPQLENMIRGVTASCRRSTVQVSHALILDGLDERQASTVVMGLRQAGFDAEVTGLDDGEAASKWLYRRVVSFDFETDGDLAILLGAFKGMSLLRGWGAFRSATGGMLKGRPRREKPSCPFCGSELGKAIGEVPEEQVEFVPGKGYRWRGPPGDCTRVQRAPPPGRLTATVAPEAA